MVGIRVAPYELRTEDILAQAQNGFRGILELRLWTEEAGIIFRVPDSEGTKLCRGQRKFTGPDWVALCDRYLGEKYGSTLQD